MDAQHERVEKIGENAYLVAVPVYFTVMLDDDGAVRSVEQSGSTRKWVKGARNPFGKAYGKDPSGILAKAARLARVFALGGSKPC